MSPSLARWLTLSGLFLGLVGVMVLFRYGMPFHVPTNGADFIKSSYINPADIAIERRYDLYGYAGLVCLIVGTILQMVALWPPRAK